MGWPVETAVVFWDRSHAKPTGIFPGCSDAKPKMDPCLASVTRFARAARASSTFFHFPRCVAAFMRKWRGLRNPHLTAGLRGPLSMGHQWHPVARHKSMLPTPLRIDLPLPEYRFRMGLHFPYTYINRGGAFFARFFCGFFRAALRGTAAGRGSIGAEDYSKGRIPTIGPVEWGRGYESIIHRGVGRLPGAPPPTTWRKFLPCHP